MKDGYAKQLEDAAKLTSRLVEGLRWIEKEGPTEGRLESMCSRVGTVHGMLSAALDKENEYTHGSELEKLQLLNQHINSLIKDLLSTSKDVYLRIHVLDALEKIDPEPDGIKGH